MSERRAPWVSAPWDWAGQCVALAEDYAREKFGVPLTIQVVQDWAQGDSQ